MILFKKYNDKNEELKAWTRLFESIEDLLVFMSEKKRGLLGDKYSIVIEEI